MYFQPKVLWYLVQCMSTWTYISVRTKYLWLKTLARMVKCIHPLHFWFETVNLCGIEPQLIKLEFIILLPKLKVIEYISGPNRCPRGHLFLDQNMLMNERNWTFDLVDPNQIRYTLRYTTLCKNRSTTDVCPRGHTFHGPDWFRCPRGHTFHGPNRCPRGHLIWSTWTR